MVGLEEMMQWLLAEDLKAMGMGPEAPCFTLHAVGDCPVDESLQLLDLRGLLADTSWC